MQSLKMKILLADDHLVVRKGLAALIEDSPNLQVVAQGENGVEAVELYKIHKPHLCILDIQMPKLSGVAATEQILKFDPAAKIILFTTYDGDEDIFRGLNAGAKAYLLKDAKTEEIFKAIERVNAGGRYIPSEIGEKLYSRQSIDELSSREDEILQLLSEGYSNREISSRKNISENTVKTHVSNIIEKLGATSRTEAVLIATKRGLLRK